MTTINDAYINALLADAAYADNLQDGLSDGDLAVQLAPRMTQPQAAFIAANFSIIAHNESSDLTGSGFDATVWAGNPGTQYAGKMYVSMQGTLGPADFLTDGDLATSGAARAQILDMVNWWLRITTPTTSQASQIRIGLDGSFVAGNPVAGTGQLVGVSHVEVNGHSLGGHLATAFARLFGGTLTIDHVTTFNSAGFHAISEPVFLNLENLLGTGAGGFLSDDKQTNVFAEHGISVTTNSFFFSQIGQRLSLFNEEGSAPSNHSMYKLTDALALMNAMSVFDQNLTIETANTILDAAAASADRSLESMLDAMRKLAGSTDTTQTTVGDVGDSAASRVDYHGKLALLLGMVQNNSTLRGTIVPLGANASDAAALAKTDLAYRYALSELNPFAVIGFDYSRFNANGELDLVDSASGTGSLSDKWLTDRAAMLAWTNKADQTDTIHVDSGQALDGAWEFDDYKTGKSVIVQPAGGIGNAEHYVRFGSDQDSFIVGGSKSDRLYGMGGNDDLRGQGGADYIEGGTGNDQLDGGADGDTMAGGTGDDTYLVDEGTDVVIERFGEGTDTIYAATNYVLPENVENLILTGRGNLAATGNELDNVLIGGDDASNVINGSGGADLIVGGQRRDWLIGGGGDEDIVFGDGGDDILLAGGGSATLIGDSGNDAYFYNSTADGAVAIEDIDGSVYYDGSLLQGGKRQDEGNVYSDGAGNQYVWAGGVLTINGNVTVTDFRNGDLSIVLTDENGNPDPENRGGSGDGSGNAGGGTGSNGDARGKGWAGSPNGGRSRDLRRWGIPGLSPFPGDFRAVRDRFLGAKTMGIVDPSKLPSPIVLDLNGDGIETTSVDSSTYFDHDANGFAERTGWVGKDDGLLVWDRNGNGRIESGRELFGSESILADGTKAENGFAALAELDTNGDGVVDADDTGFADLRVWRDANGDGYSVPDELLSLADAGVASIDVDYNTSTHVDSFGNEHRQVGGFTRTDGSYGEAVDVWFVSDSSDTLAETRLAVPLSIAQLPNLQGHGNLYDLHQAMARDSSGQLHGLVQSFTVENDVQGRNVLFEQILFRWAGVQSTAPGSRGIYVDARKLGVLEGFLGERFVGSDGNQNPGYNVGPALDEPYQKLAAVLYGQLMAQTHLKSLYDSIRWNVDVSSKLVKADFTLVVSQLDCAYTIDAQVAIANLKEFLRTAQVLGVLSNSNLGCLSYPAWFFDQDGLMIGGREIGVLVAGSGNDTITDSDGSDTIDGGAGDDTITDSGTGTNVLRGGDGND
ncbi:MAG: hypothetical protein OEL88_15390, partial [Sterolibacteriaceae bacterium MAG5]|nr:hypothetical protein [Candidatus Nitricoxidireducens bremensis]